MDLSSIGIIEEFKLLSGKVVIIKPVSTENLNINHNYEFLHTWLQQINKYLTRNFNKEDLKKNKREYFKALSKPNEYIRIGAFHNEKIIGHCSLHLTPQKKKLRHVGSWGLVIHPVFQNQGLGTRLLEIIEQIGKERGLKRLEASYVEGNKGAERLYIGKLKYEIEGRRKAAICMDDGTYRNAVCIGKIIN